MRKSIKAILSAIIPLMGIILFVGCGKSTSTYEPNHMPNTPSVGQNSIEKPIEEPIESKKVKYSAMEDDDIVLVEWNVNYAWGFSSYGTFVMGDGSIYEFCFTLDNGEDVVETNIVQRLKELYKSNDDSITPLYKSYDKKVLEDIYDNGMHLTGKEKYQSEMVAIDAGSHCVYFYNKDIDKNILLVETGDFESLINSKYAKEIIKLKQREDSKLFSETQTDDKPNIYIYAPEDDYELNIKLDYKGKLTALYPLYNNGNSWDVVVNKDGIIRVDGRQYNYLYWEGEHENIYKIKTGYCVKKEDTISFLEEKLTVLGLNEQEQDDFISYWLPKLYKNTYNVISFDNSTYLSLATIETNKTPNTIIRVFMTFIGVDKPIDIQSDMLTPAPNRSGLTIVEWGGSEISAIK